MLRGRQVTISVMLMFVIGFVFMLQSAIGDSAVYGISFGGRHIESQIVYKSHKGDKLTDQKRDGEQVDDWVERGSSSVTDSPKYKKGIRLATWATRDDDEYDFGLASAVYQFQVPSGAQSIKIKIRYDGESGKYSVDDNIAGRVWIRAKNPADRYERRYSNERRATDEALYGDTFTLPEKKGSEEIEISAGDHVVNGIMELHVIAEGGQRIDVDYIKVEAYRSIPKVRVITREYRNYAPRPWYHHTYSYFYTGPVYYFSGRNYLVYTYPRNYNAIEIRGRYGRYLGEYQARHSRINLSWSGRLNFPNIVIGGSHGIKMARWTPGYEKTKETYKKNHGRMQNPVSIREFRKQIQDTTREHRKPSNVYVERKKDKDDRDYRDGRGRGR